VSSAALDEKCRKKVPFATSAAAQICSTVTGANPRTANRSIAARKISPRVRSFLRARRLAGIGIGVATTIRTLFHQ
jgi:hypothetical protein